MVQCKANRAQQGAKSGDKSCCSIPKHEVTGILTELNASIGKNGVNLSGEDLKKVAKSHANTHLNKRGDSLLRETVCFS